MKRFIYVLSSLLVLPAFAEVAPTYYDDFIEYNDDMFDDEIVVDENEAEQKQVQQNVQKQNVQNRTTISRNVPASRVVSAGTTTNQRSNASSRAIASSPRNTTNSSTRALTSRTAKTSNVANRNSGRSTVSRASVTSRNTSNAKPVTARVGTSNNTVISGNKNVNYGSTATLKDSGSPLYYSNTSRVGVNNRRGSARISSATLSTTTPVVTKDDVTETADTLNALAELTDYCKAQYASCMDNYCNVLDDNQGRCSCSKNLKNYSKIESALNSASEEFQNAIQKIRYIGLTGAQIESLFAETEAELSMKTNSDSSRLKSSLDAIKKKIVDVSTPTSASSEVTNGLSLDMSGLLNADFTSGFDLNSFLGINSANTQSVSNQRGEQLFKTATSRCKASVLNSCVAQGVDANVITNSYDLEIDKQCMAYERSLNEANTEMRNNVTNATNILQQARLMLNQQKNSYDLRGCIAAIDACMQDEYVCGSEYELCLDPTGKYLANGEIVKGGTPGVAGGQTRNTTIPSVNELETWKSGGMYNLYATWNYKDNTMNAWGVGKSENLGAYIDDYLTTWTSIYKNSKDSTKTDSMATYLLQKIGYIDSDDKVHGMCASVMKQCQDYTFKVNKSTKTYIPDNEVVRQYLNSTLAKIKVKQDEILSDYAENCRTDVQSCLSTNGYDESNPNSTISKTAVNSCSAEITTCMSVGGYQVSDGAKLTLRQMTDWVSAILINCPTNTYLVDKDNATQCKSCESVNIGTNIGGTFAASGNKTVPTYSAGGQVTTCTCSDEYTTFYDEDGKVKGCILKTTTATANSTTNSTSSEVCDINNLDLTTTGTDISYHNPSEGAVNQPDNPTGTTGGKIDLPAGHWVTEFEGTIIYGSAVCSNSVSDIYTLNQKPTSMSTGAGCWCKAESYTQGTTTCNVDSTIWYYGGTGGCGEWCSKTCAEKTRDELEFRQALFGLN